jgi:pimeloyl-ACP methyl ester carboxylesterase
MQLQSIHPAVLHRFYAQQVHWSPCHSNLECGTLQVPLDYTHPAGQAISLQLVRHVTSATDRLGSVVLNPGGPGASGVSYAVNAWSAVSAELQNRFDVVSFDPRGVAGSDPIRCATPALEDQFIAYDADPQVPSQVAHLAQLNRDFDAGCAARSAPLLAHVGTVDTARDLDILRAVLGDDKLTYIGSSYGTFLGTLYAQLFPTRVRALVLDGAIDPSLDDVSEGVGQAAGFETALHSFVVACVRAGGCPLGSSQADAEPRLDNWLAGLTGRPLRNGDGRLLTRSLAISAIAGGLYTPRQWSSLTQALRAGLAGDPSQLFELADRLFGRNPDGSYDNEVEASVAINCADRPAASKTIEDAASSALAAGNVWPTFGQALGWGNSACIGWPVPAELAPGPVRAIDAPPIVVLGTLRDPATPFNWAQALAHQLASGVLVSWDGDGHTANLRGSACVDAIVRGYVVSLKVPPQGTACGPG